MGSRPDVSSVLENPHPLHLALQPVVAAASAGGLVELLGMLCGNPVTRGPLSPDNESAVGGGASHCANRDGDFLIGTLGRSLPAPLIVCDVYSATSAHWPSDADLHQQLHSAGRTGLTCGEN